METVSLTVKRKDNRAGHSPLEPNTSTFMSVFLVVLHEVCCLDTGRFVPVCTRFMFSISNLTENLSTLTMQNQGICYGLSSENVQAGPT